ncbi:MAG: isoprenylcysteine carboxylmethyltransferase family protein [Saprospiraceae bacterium]|nr:isoprenylcysteine carboxylmethyltransferase family protein [Saprospiraceae bacterium]
MAHEWITFFSWAFFYALHSALAADPVKDRVMRWRPGIRQYYRLAYNTFSILFFCWLLADLYRNPGGFLYSFSIFFYVPGGMLALSGVFLLGASFRNYDLLEFAGVQASEASQTLQTGGLNAWVRHPIYSGVLLLMLGICLVYPTTSLWAILASTVVYLPFGIWWEEKKLLRQYGRAYSDYQKRVKRLIPGLW